MGTRPDATVIRPSLMFGAGDGFFTRFASLARLLPILPLVGAETRLQPVFVGDVAEAIAKAVDGDVPGARIYEAGGPEIRTLRDIVQYVLDITERRALVIALPRGLGRVQGSALGLLDKVTLGLMPDELVMTRDQALMLEHDNVVSDEAIAEGRTLPGLGIEPTSFEAIVPTYLVRFRRTGQFDLKRNAAPGETPSGLMPDSGRADTAAR
jgi:NADH dehydrogenase